MSELPVILSHITPIEQEGEKIYELVKSPSKVGIALAEIEESEWHKHEKRHEWYHVLEGFGVIEARGKRKPGRVATIVELDSEAFVEKGTTLYISPGTVHRARNAVNVPDYPEVYVPFKVLVISYPPWSEDDHILV
jgi:mannose-6-phosphate isomerase-like protein (cupin superfamily)